MIPPQQSQIFAPLFADAEVSSLISDEAYVSAMVEVEKALARAEARAGVIPRAAAEQINRAADGKKIDRAVLSRGAARSGFPVIALIEELRKLVGPEAAAYIHWGATTQDIMDTASILQLRAVSDLLKRRLLDLVRELSALARRYRTTVLAARTHGQQALPLTFGLKVANWLAPLARHAERLNQIAPRLFTVQFGGAAGTLAALGDKGLAVVHALADELKLATPATPWHAQRDTLVEFAGWLGLVTGSLGKMAQDVILLAQTEVDEVAESPAQDRGASSTMPQKQNPITSELIVAAARANASLVSAMHHAQIQEHERATHGWQLEWLSLPQMILLTGGALEHALYLARNLQVNARAMRANMQRAHDVILAEAAVFALAKAIPRAEAEALVKKACALAAAEGKPLLDVVKTLARDCGSAGAVDWQALGKPENYLGETDRIIDSALASANRVLE
ncbi:MAG TPA: 3-carboxy-cis,cis-muconate cycloisomerase [Candidatus Acidoferrales bacterium]|nr:3-carboxy-cis,cis-muconate cycloisomerase [Candidatus Acidoferrales bacterium]